MFTARCVSKYSQCIRVIHQMHLRKSSTTVKEKPSLLKRHLALVNSITSGICMGLGDLIQQEIEYNYKVLPERYDWKRACDMFLTGCVLGPIHHYYYLKLDAYFPGTSFRPVAWKIALDQFVAAPLTYVTFFLTLGVLEKKSWKESTGELKQKFIYAYLADWLFWPPVQFINFYYLPWQYRVLYINVTTMIFNVFLSYVKHDI